MKHYLNLFKALSDETRLRIVVLLSQKELCVCQIEEALKLSQVKVSRHLTVLKYSGLVEARRQGLWVYYSLKDPKNKVEENLFNSFNQYLSKEKELKADLANMKKCVRRPVDKGTQK